MQANVLEYLDKSLLEYPDCIAYESESEKITFSEVAKIANSIGSMLCNCAEPKQVVLVLFEKTVFTSSLFLGVAFAGDFYAPLSVDLPIMRLKTIIEVSEANILLTDEAHKEFAQSLGFKGVILTLEQALKENISQEKLAQIRKNAQDTDPLYIIFTSGSSGKPKGVLTSHHALIESIDAYVDTFGINDKTVLASQAPFDYIAAIRDIYLPLSTGAKTVIVPKSMFSTPQILFDYVNAHNVNTLCWAASALALCADLGAFNDGNSLKNIQDVIFAGSVMPCKQLRIWQNNLPQTRFINHYGPTETTRSCTYYIVDKLVDENDVLPIGIPFKNTGILLLDENHKPVAIGEIGEICVKGSCLALGYYRNQEKTKEVFIPNPLQDNYEEIIYKTGDLGILNSDGNYTFHGRKDFQIKHMGHRVELGDIEVAASAIPAINSCCCLYNNAKELIYLFYTGETDKREIAINLRQQLPSHMIPRRFIKLDEMPCTFNGKINMEALKQMM